MARVFRMLEQDWGQHPLLPAQGQRPEAALDPEAVQAVITSHLPAFQAVHVATEADSFRPQNASMAFGFPDRALVARVEDGVVQALFYTDGGVGEARLLAPSEHHRRTEALHAALLGVLGAFSLVFHTDDGAEVGADEPARLLAELEHPAVLQQPTEQAIVTDLAWQAHAYATAGPGQAPRLLYHIVDTLDVVDRLPAEAGDALAKGWRWTLRQAALLLNAPEQLQEQHATPSVQQLLSAAGEVVDAVERPGQPPPQLREPPMAQAAYLLVLADTLAQGSERPRLDQVEEVLGASVTPVRPRSRQELLDDPPGRGQERDPGEMLR